MDFFQELGLNPNDSCIVNGQIYVLSSLEQMGLEKFSNFVHINNPPLRLVRYFRYNEKTKNNLKEGTVYLNDTERFDDCFDCAIDLDYGKFAEERLRKYCLYFDVDISDVSIEYIPYKIALKLFDFGSAEKAIDEIDDTLDEVQKLRIEHFVRYVYNAIKDQNDWVPAIVEEIQSEHRDFVDSFKYFKMTCFTTSPYLNRMWATNDSKGFCVEYEIDYKSELFVNLFPVIYSQKRNDFFPLSCNSDKQFMTDDLWHIYFNGLLRKSLHWVDQNEWRLIQCEFDKKAKNIPFFKAKKVYFGNKMQVNDRKEIIAVCNEIGVPYVGLVRANNSFDLVECPNNCSSCHWCDSDTLQLSPRKVLQKCKNRRYRVNKRNKR